MDNKSKPNFFEFFFALTVMSALSAGIIYIVTIEVNKEFAKEYCKYSSDSKICQELANNCLTWGMCISSSDSKIPEEILNDLSYIQIYKMANKVREIKNESIRNTKAVEKEIKKEMHSIEIK